MYLDRTIIVEFLETILHEDFHRHVTGSVEAETRRASMRFLYTQWRGIETDKFANGERDG